MLPSAKYFENVGQVRLHKVRLGYTRLGLATQG